MKYKMMESKDNQEEKDKEQQPSVDGIRNVIEDQVASEKEKWKKKQQKVKQKENQEEKDKKQQLSVVGIGNVQEEYWVYKQRDTQLHEL